MMRNIKALDPEQNKVGCQIIEEDALYIERGRQESTQHTQAQRHEVTMCR